MRRGSTCWSGMGCLNYRKGKKIMGETIFTKLRYTDNIRVCSFCNSRLERKSTVTIRLRSDKGKVVHMQDSFAFCNKCGIPLTDRAHYEVRFKDNFYYADISYPRKLNDVSDSTEYIRNPKERRRDYQQYLFGIPSAIILVELKSISTGKIVACTVVENEKYAMEKRNRVHYRSILAREVLAAAFVDDKEKTALIFDEKYSVIQVVVPINLDLNDLYRIVPHEWTIKSGGGLYSKRTETELVDMLVYSPYSTRYEIVKATYDRSSDVAYTDIHVFRSFIRVHGNPNMNIQFISKSGNGTGFFDNLNTVSFLKEYGYDVSKKKGMTQAERQSILAELVDLRLMTVAGIWNHLEFCIRSHTEEKYVWARQKWREDIQFISSYKVNPSRFMIAKR